MSVAVPISIQVLLILGVVILISFLILPFIYFLIILLTSLSYCFWCWYKENYKDYDFLSFAKPWFRKIRSSGNHALFSNGASFANEAVKYTNFLKSRKLISSGSQITNNINTSIRSPTEPHLDRCVNSHASLRLTKTSSNLKNVQAAGGPLLYHEENSFDTSNRSFNTSSMFDSSFNSRYGHYRRNYTAGSGFLGDLNRTLVMPRRRYPTHQSNYVFLGQFPSVHFNKSEAHVLDLNKSTQNRVTVKLAPPQVLTPSQRINFSTSLSPSTTSPTKSLSDPNPCDSKTILAALKENNRKRSRKDKDSATENEAKRRRQETDSDSDSSIVASTGNNMEIMNDNSESLMKALQGKRPATPLNHNESSPIQSLPKRHKNDILTISYSSSKRLYKDDVILSLPKKRQATNFSPSAVNKVSRTRENNISDNEIELNSNDSLDSESAAPSHNSKTVEDEMEQPAITEISSPIRKEGQSHKRTLTCYAELGKSSSNVYSFPQYIPTLDDCEEHQKIEEDRVRKLLGTPLTLVSTVSSEFKTPSTVAFSTPVSSFGLDNMIKASEVNSTVVTSVSSDALTSKPTISSPFSFGKTTKPEEDSKELLPVASSSTRFSVESTVSPPSNSFFSNQGNSVTTTQTTSFTLSNPLSVMSAKSTEKPVDVTDSSNVDSFNKTPNIALSGTSVSQSESEKTQTSVFVPNKNLSTILSTSASSIPPSTVPSFTEAFKFSSSPTLTPSLVKTPATTSSFNGFGVPDISTPVTNPLSLFGNQEISQPTNLKTLPVVSNSDQSVVTCTLFPTISSVTNSVNSASSTTTTGLVTTAINPIFSFGLSESTPKTSTGVFPFSSTSDSTITFGAQTPLSSLNVNQTQTDKKIDGEGMKSSFFTLSSGTPSTVSNPQATLAAPTAFQFSNAVSVPSSTSAIAPFSFGNSLQTSSLKPAAPIKANDFSLSGGTTSLNKNLTFDFNKPNQETKTTNFFNPPVSSSSNTSVFGSVGTLPSYSEAMSGGNVLGQTNSQNAVAAFGSNTSGNVLGQSNSQNPIGVFGSNTSGNILGQNNTQSTNASTVNIFGSNASGNILGQPIVQNANSSAVSAFGSNSSNIFSQATPNFSFGATPSQDSLSISNPFNSNSTNNSQATFPNGFGSTQTNTAFGSLGSTPLNFGNNTVATPSALSTPFGATDPSKPVNNFSFTNSMVNQPSSFGAPQQTTTPAFQFNLGSKNFNFSTAPAPEQQQQQPAFGAPQINKPYIFGGGVPPQESLFSIGSGVREKRTAAVRRRHTRK